MLDFILKLLFLPPEPHFELFLLASILVAYFPVYLLNHERNFNLDELPDVVKQVSVEASSLNGEIRPFLCHVSHRVLDRRVHVRDETAEVIILDKDLIGNFVAEQDQIIFLSLSLFFRLRV